METTVPPDVILARRAARQLGIVSRADALRVGMSCAQIGHRLRSRRWQALAPGVYRISGVPEAWQQEALAACLSFGHDAVASHVTAAALWGLLPPSRLPHVTVPPSASARARWAKVHRSSVAPQDRTVVGSTPVTRLGRTLADCAMVLRGDALLALVDTALDGQRMGLLELEGALDRAGGGGRRGPARSALLAALEPWLDPIRPDSPAEARLLRRLAQWGMPTPDRQVIVRDGSGCEVGRVDVGWPDRMVGLEYDSAEWHGLRRLEHDEARHAAVSSLGWRLVHADRLDLRAGDDRLRGELIPLLAA